MIATQFGIIDNISQDKDYSSYEPEKYHCIDIDDEKYIDDWWPKLSIMKTFFHNLNRPSLGLARYGVTLIPPESLVIFQDIVLSDERIKDDDHLICLAERIETAIRENKYLIHYGI